MSFRPSVLALIRYWEFPAAMFGHQNKTVFQNILQLKPISTGTTIFWAWSRVLLSFKINLHNPCFKQFFLWAGQSVWDRLNGVFSSPFRLAGESISRPAAWGHSGLGAPPPPMVRPGGSYRAKSLVFASSYYHFRRRISEEPPFDLLNYKHLTQRSIELDSLQVGILSV